MMPDFDKAWSDLNVRLRELELGSGLTAALYELESYHVHSGFIRDTLQDVERYTFHHPDDPARFFRVQYNPRRARRFAGSGRRNGTPLARNDGCFLCRDNIKWQQHGTQLGYQITTDERVYYALTNPFPLSPVHVVVASAEHRPQEWGFRDDNGLGADMLIDDLVRLADRMPGYGGFYNGVGAGASIAGHLHFQFVRRPDDTMVFPLEVAAENAGGRMDGPGSLAPYPLEAAVWKGLADDVVARAGDWIRRWGERNRSRLDGLTANLIAVRDKEGDDVALYFVPRNRLASKPEGFSGLIGGLEVLGEIVMSSPEEKARLDAGKIDYFALEAILARVHTPLEAG